MMDKNCITFYGLRWNSMAVSGYRITLMTSCKTVLPGPRCHHKPSLGPDLFSSENSTFPGKLCDLCKIPFPLLYKNAIKFIENTMFNIFKKKPKESAKLFYHTDVHSHILPGVDHGSQNVGESLEMLRAELDMGITHVMCTSHVTAETFENTPETLTAAYEELKQAVEAEGLPINIYASAEYRIDEYWTREYEAGHLLPMPGKRILLENSFVQELIGIDNMLFELQVKGYRPILAHPERYRYYYDHKERYKSLHSASVKFQVNLLSLTGYFGRGARETALWLIQNNLCDMFGSDMHGMDHAREIQDYIGSREWRKLCDKYDLPKRIVNDREFEL